MSQCSYSDFAFDSRNCSLRVSGRLITRTFTDLPGSRRDVLVLHFILSLASRRVNHLVKVSHDTMRHREADALGSLHVGLVTFVPRKNWAQVGRSDCGNGDPLPSFIVSTTYTNGTRTIRHILRRCSNCVGGLYAQALCSNDNRPRVYVSRCVGHQLRVGLVRSVIDPVNS